MTQRAFTDRRVVNSFEVVAVASFVVFALVYVRPIEIGAAVAGTVLLLASRMLQPWDNDVAEHTTSIALAGAAVLLGTGVLMWFDEAAVGITAVFMMPVAIAVAYLVLRGSVERAITRSIGLVLLFALIGVVSILWIVIPQEPRIDALLIHGAGADSLLAGENPYVTARVPNTNPFAPEGAEFVGYTYPPTVLLTYAGSDILLGDARWATVIAIALTMALMIRPWAEMTRAQAGAALALALAMAVQPALGWVFLKGWTDALALPLMLGSGLLWRRNPALAAVLLGLAFGTKQYFILALPLLLLWRDDYRWPRFWISTGVAALSVLPALLVDAVAYWNATVAPSLSAPIRDDSAGLAGLGLDLPMVVVAAVSIGVAVWMARGAGGQTRFLLALAALLATAFLFGFQAFINYWFLIGNLALVAVVAGLASGTRVRGDGPATEATTPAR